MYKHHAFSDLLHETCFRSTFDLGIIYENVFDEYIGINTFAFICTMVCLLLYFFTCITDCS